jgi:ribonuclease HII
VRARIAGIDEAGRGPLAGPVVAAAVILKPGRAIPGLADSKVLRPEVRAEISVQIRRRALCYGIGWADPAEIDSLNILQATFLAMRRAVLAMSVCPERLIVDGNRLPRLDGLGGNLSGLGAAVTARAIIGGDATEPSISAASILAKTARDEYMNQMDTIFPEYAFASHKGYATREHRSRLREHGPCALHRRSFAPVFALESGLPAGAGADEWDSDLEWVPEIDQDAGLESYLER